jgi:ATP-binding cassette subfamily F protein 3
VAISENLLQVQGLCKSFASRNLLENAAFAVNEDEHIGVIGPNGAGKTTMFKILTGEIEFDKGQVIRSSQLRLGYLPQHDEWSATETVEEFLTRAKETPIWTLKSLARRLGITDQQFSKPITALSGGYRMRLKLVFLFGCKPNLMLLDEPTNYLDLETLLVLEEFLANFRGAFLLISHDREFLKRVCDHTLEVEEGVITKYNGHIEDYFEQKAMLAEQLQKTAANQAAKRAQIQAFIDRFGAKASKARQAQSRVKRLEKMEKIEIKSLPVRAEIVIPAPLLRDKKLAVQLESATLGYDQNAIVKKVDLMALTGERIGIVGLNGQGKSTLLKSLAGALPLIEGKLSLGYNVSIGYYAQHIGETLDPNKTVFQELDSVTSSDYPRQAVMDLAGSLLFRGDDIKKPVKVLSGGERARVALGKILLGRHSCLLLDEPTNHLDFHTVEALSQALAKFEGCVFVVSHDRSFIQRVANKIVEVDQGKVRAYPGNYDDYLWALEQRLAREAAEAPQERSPSPKKMDAPAPPKAASNKINLKQLEKMEKKMEALRQAIEANAIEMQGATPARLQVLAQEVEIKQKELEILENEWLKAHD